MTSSVTSSYSEDGLRDQSRESAGSLHPDESEKRRRREHPVASYSATSRCYLEIAIAKRCRLHKLIRQRFALAIKIQQETFALIISADEATMDSVATQRYPDAIDEPDASNSSIQSRAYLNQLLLYIQSRATVSSRKKIQAQRIEEVAKRSSRGDNSAAKQLTTYEEISKLDVNC
ncbi:hypothetical protein F511_23011 [Dorcoceras hygrometricum]|uniref:Uncharacterized protein n=1 Tax=Dorcoceras hygrometricum TaxID=472368 RepID=A0A2Z7AYH2_9LAMI|nr:hypothetical protein F511_23011 [Dorcoceras hygrometricum]